MTKEQKRQSWTLELIVTLIRVIFLGAVIVTALQGNWESASICAVGLVLSFVPQFIERSYRVDLPVGYELIIVVFMFATMFLGEVGHAYTLFWWWDIVLHASSGVLLGYVGFLVLYILYRQHKLKASAGVIAFFTFAVGMASAGIWEVFEFSMDQLFGLHMQRGAVDTMSDIIVAGLGSLLAASAAYMYIKHPSNTFYRPWIQSFFSSNPHLRQTQKKAKGRSTS